MALIKRLNHDPFEYGDIVKVTGVPGTKGKRFKFVGAMFNEDNPETPEHYELIEIARGQFRAIRPQYVSKDEKASKDAHKRAAAKLAEKESKSG